MHDEIPPPDDAALLAAIARGDPAALAALHERYAPAARRCAQRLPGDPEAAAEVVQDAFLAV